MLQDVLLARVVLCTDEIFSSDLWFGEWLDFFLFCFHGSLCKSNEVTQY